MIQPWQKPVRLALEAECKELLIEAIMSEDVDLLQEMAAKMTDVIIVYRRSLKAPRTTFMFSDGVTRSIDEMALLHAAREVFGEIEEGDE